MGDFVKLSEVKEGDILIADGRFTCVKAGEVLIHSTSNFPMKQLYFKCDQGHHYLDGQLKDGKLIGLRKPNQKSEKPDYSSITRDLVGG